SSLKPVSQPTSAKATRVELNAAELPHFAELTVDLAELGRNFYGRGWLLGTSGNFSAVVRREPLRLAITPSGVDKGRLSREQIIQVDENGGVIGGSGKPSVETALHLAIVRLRKAAAVLHTHSVWSTLLSQSCAASGGIAIEGYEMLKGLEGVHTHQ